MTDQVTTKVCGKCKADKTFDSFGKKAYGKYGLSAQCKICHNEESKAWRKANLEKAKAASNAWRKANLEKAKAASKAWARANPEKRAAASKAWRKANLEKAKAAYNAWARANPEKRAAASKAWRKANREKVSDRSKSRHKANPEKRAARAKAYVDRCNDNYVARTMGLKLSQCPQELIELKRINILITREIRNQQCQN